jgi:ADP-ribose pyrophosphatase YjhB (NUDIX family)
VSVDQPSIAVSTVIFAMRPHPETGASTVWIPLVRRIRAPYRDRWALPGGPLRNDEDLIDAARHNLLDTTGLTPRYLEQLYAFGAINRAPGQRVVSIVYWALVRGDEADRTQLDENISWHSTDDLPELAFDHNLIVEYALWRLRTKMEYSRIAHAFLGERFTLAQLRDVHEAVLQKPVDAGNFRRMVESTKAVVPTDEFVTGTPHRPARLYRYDASVDLTDQGPLRRQRPTAPGTTEPATTAPGTTESHPDERKSS